MDTNEVKKLLACNGIVDGDSKNTIYKEMAETLQDAGLKCELDFGVDDCFEDLENMNILTISHDTGIVMGHTMHEFTRKHYDGKLMCIEWIIFVKNGKYKACFRNQFLGTVYDINETHTEYKVRFTSRIAVDFDDIEKAILFVKSNIIEGMIGEAALDALGIEDNDDERYAYAVPEKGLVHHENEPVDCDDINSQGSIRMPGM